MLRTRITTVGVVALALSTPTTAGAQQDLRSPDTRDAAAAATAGQDLRSPDTRDATRPIVPAGQDVQSPDARDAAAAATAGQDLRSPDTRDATRPIAPAQAPAPVQPSDRAPDGFGWADASIGAAGMLGIVLALAGIALLTAHQRRRDQVPFARR